VKIRWSSAATALARRYLRDQDGYARSALLSLPWPVIRLRVSRYRVLYVVDGDVITIERVDRLADD
jgi:hypothetical protein